MTDAYFITLISCLHAFWRFFFRLLSSRLILFSHSRFSSTFGVKLKKMMMPAHSRSQTFTMRRSTLLFLSFCIISSSGDFCQNRFEKRLQTLDLLDKQLNYLWYQLGQEVINTKRGIIEGRAKSNRINYSVITGVIMGNILRLAGRVSLLTLF